MITSYADPTAMAKEFRGPDMTAFIETYRRGVDDEIRRLLSLWVSEVEPEIYYTDAWRLLGIGHGGVVVLHAGG